MESARRLFAGGRRHALLALPPALVALLYGRTLGYEFVWDDNLILAFPAYRSLDVIGVFTSAANGVEYLPVRDLSLILDRALFGSWAGGFHLVNVLLFAACVFLVHRLYQLLFAAGEGDPVRSRSTGAALACALVFAAHPLQVEPVAFVTQRNNLLALLFASGAMLSYATHLLRGSQRLYMASLALLVLALFSKASAVSLPLLLGLLHLTLVRTEGLWRTARRLGPHLALTGLAIAVHAWFAVGRGLLDTGLSPVDLAARLPRMVFVAAFYVFKFVWPVGLTIEYDLRSTLERPVLLAVGVAIPALAWGLVVLRGWRRRSLGWLLALGYGVALLPVLNLFPTHQTVADRYAQLPLVFLTPLLVAPLVARLPRGPALGAVALLVVALSVLTARQVPVWKSDEALFQHAAAVNPRAKRSLQNLGIVLLNRGRTDEALRAYERLAALDPADYHHHYLLGRVAFEQGRLGEAERWLRSAADKRGPARHRVHMLLGEIYIEREQYARALDAYQRARALAERMLLVEPDRQQIAARLRFLYRQGATTR